MKHRGSVMKSLSAALLIKLLHLLTLTAEWDRKYVSACRRPHSRFKRLKYSGGEGRGVKSFHSHCFIFFIFSFFSNWQVSWQDGDILSSSHFFRCVPLWSRVALHHACQREVNLEQLVVVGGASTTAGRNLNLQESKTVCTIKNKHMVHSPEGLRLQIDNKKHKKLIKYKVEDYKLETESVVSVAMDLSTSWRGHWYLGGYFVNLFLHFYFCFFQETHHPPPLLTDDCSRRGETGWDAVSLNSRSSALHNWLQETLPHLPIFEFSPLF